MVRWPILVVMLAAISTIAIGQETPVDPVLAAFREYRAAVERNDWIAADTAASAAWQLSEAREGGRGRTAVLAMNAAIARLQRDHHTDALAPARRALELAEGGAPGVDVLSARLVVGRSLLPSDLQAGEALLLSALPEAALRGEEIDALGYAAAQALGVSAAQSEHWDVSLTGWRAAIRHGAGAPGNPNLVRAEALAGQGAALMALNRDPGAFDMLSQSISLFSEASLAIDAAHPSPAVAAYIRALEQRSILRERMTAQGTPPPTDGRFAAEWVRRPEGAQFARYYPQQALERGRSGSAVLCCTPRADQTLSCRVAFEHPAGEGFGDAAMRIVREFRMSPEPYALFLADPHNWLQVPINFSVSDAPVDRPPVNRTQSIIAEATQGLCRPPLSRPTPLNPQPR